MTDLEHEQLFFDFVKQNPQLEHLSYRTTVLKTQKIIGILVDESSYGDKDSDTYVPYYTDYVKNLESQTSTVIIDPNWDKIYDNFINLDHGQDSIDYIKSVVESLDTRELVGEFIVEKIAKKLVASLINAKKVYFVIDDTWSTDWLNEVIEV
jgi:hypothetical protein